MKLDLALLKRLLVIDHPSKQEWPMLSFIINECYKIGNLEFEMDCYNNIFRIIVSISIFIICILFFIPLFNLFRMQLSTALEKRQIRIDEEEYERMQLREKLDDEVWEDLKFDESQEAEKIEMNLKLCDFERESTKA